jgi:dinuclear metal center YbgI/SA1388 family protein
MPAKRDKIIEYLDKYLKVKDFEDYCNNGLQIEGKENISKIITGVSLSQRLINEAIGKKADMIIVHHGIFLNDVPSPLRLKGLMKNRIKTILENDINLVGYHLPLDAHSIIGNNISLAKLFGVKKCQPIDVGFVGELDRKIDFEKFVDLVNQKLDVKSFILPYGKKKIKRVAIISGGASPEFEIANELGVDVYISGDIRESVVRRIEEVKINFINAGHYNTEKLGIQNLGKLLEKKFKVETEFVDVPCEV